MARLRSKLRPAPWAMAVVMWDVWKRLSPRQRRQIMAMARRHGPTVITELRKLRSRRP